MSIWHLVYSSPGRQTIFPDETSLLAAVHALGRGANGSIVLFCIVDDHIHLVVETARSGRVAAQVLRSLQTVTDIDLDPAYRREVRTRSHLELLASRYIVKQPEKHGLNAASALWSGSCFLDLVGARRLPSPPLRLRNVLPRYKLRSAFETAGLGGEPLARCTDADLRRAGAARIVSVSAAATGVPCAVGRDLQSARARRTAGALCAAADIPSPELAFALGMRTTSARRLMVSTADPALCAAARIRLSLEKRVALCATNQVARPPLC